MRFKFLKTSPINWKYALGEIALIFIGISIALAFNNWNEEKKAKKVEVKSLLELSAAIQQDLNDIEENIVGFQDRVDAYRALLKYLDESPPLHDSFNYYLPYLLGTTTFLSNTGPYEALKTKGLETITNDSIRIKVALYYDFEYEWILTREKEHHSHFKEYIKPFFIKHMKLQDRKLLPINTESLQQDNQFRQILVLGLMNDRSGLNAYKMVKEKGLTLLALIKAEISPSPSG